MRSVRDVLWWSDVGNAAWWRTEGMMYCDGGVMDMMCRRDVVKDGWKWCIVMEEEWWRWWDGVMWVIHCGEGPRAVIYCDGGDVLCWRKSDGDNSWCWRRWRGAGSRGGSERQVKCSRLESVVATSISIWESLPVRAGGPSPSLQV